MPQSRGIAVPFAVTDPRHAQKHLARELGGSPPCTLEADGASRRAAKSKDVRRR